MNVLWITNIELPVPARTLGNDVVVGGWMDWSSQLLVQQENINLCVMSRAQNEYEIIINNIKYVGFHEKNFLHSFSNLVEIFRPDIVHIWGTEYVHSLKAIEYLKKINKVENAILSIQGLVSVYPIHYYAYLPYKIIKRNSIYELIRKRGIVGSCKEMMTRGEYERRAIEIAKNCIGRTDWDRACIRQINPNIKYFFCNEILRASFYSKQWNYDNCNREVIAFSQADYPIKGFHIMLEALCIVKKFFPDVKLQVVGNSPFEKKGLIDSIKKSSYMIYIKQLVEKNNLFENVEWMGKLNEEQMVNHFLKANVFVCSSSIENSSNSIAEAMVLGVPVVVSDVGGIKSFIKHEEEGLIYQADAPYMLADCIMKLFINPKLASKYGCAARKRARVEHDEKYNTRRLLEIYSQLLK